MATDIVQLNFTPFLSFPAGVHVAVFVLQNKLRCLYTPWELLDCIELGQKIKQSFMNISKFTRNYYFLTLLCRSTN